MTTPSAAPAPDAGPKKGPAGRLLPVVVVVGLALLLFRLFGPGGGPAQGPVSGTILKADGTPATGMVVEAEFAVEGNPKPLVLRSAPTGADGRFAVPEAPRHWTALRVRTRQGPLAIDADLGHEPGPLDAKLTLPGTFTVQGIVVRAEGGLPLVEADVRLGGRKTRTDERGRFTFTDLPAAIANFDPQVLEVSIKGRKTQSRTLPWDAGVDDILVRLEQ